MRTPPRLRQYRIVSACSRFSGVSPAAPGSGGLCTRSHATRPYPWNAEAGRQRMDRWMATARGAGCHSIVLALHSIANENMSPPRDTTMFILHCARLNGS